RHVRVAWLDPQRREESVEAALRAERPRVGRQWHVSPVRPVDVHAHARRAAYVVRRSRDEQDLTRREAQRGERGAIWARIGFVRAGLFGGHDEVERTKTLGSAAS